ncbi:hypothetical protein E4K10_18685 [Streptomyces sp. T1317-0309]|nr:hypothetical protein E4K10_18685 [Streptomyces sp. T1317-0309]
MTALPGPRRTSAEDGTAPSADTPWIRTRLRAAPGAALALSLLVLVTAFLAAALPRAIDVQEDTALRDTVARARVVDRSVTATLDVSWLSFPYNAQALVTPRSLASTEAVFQSFVHPPLALDRRQTVYGVRTAQAAPPRTRTCPGRPRTPTRRPRSSPSRTSTASPTSWTDDCPGPARAPAPSRRPSPSARRTSCICARVPWSIWPGAAKRGSRCGSPVSSGRSTARPPTGTKSRT